MVKVFASLFTAVVVGSLAARAAGSASRRHRPKAHNREALPGLDVTPTQFWSAVLGAGVLTFVVIYGLTGLIVVASVPALVVASLPRTYFLRKRALRQAAVQEAWPDGIRDILTSIRSGASLPRAVENMALFGPEPLRDAFRGFDVYARSLGVAQALEMVKEDLADPTSDRILEILILAHERGGTAVPQILSDLAEASTRDVWTAEQVRTEALEQKINSRVVFVLPWVVLVAMTARPGPFRDFYGTSAGIAVVALGGVLSLLGILIASKLGSQPEEPRVFGGAR